VLRIEETSHHGQGATLRAVSGPGGTGHGHSAGRISGRALDAHVAGRHRHDRPHTMHTLQCRQHWRRRVQHLPTTSASGLWGIMAGRDRAGTSRSGRRRSVSFNRVCSVGRSAACGLSGGQATSSTRARTSHVTVRVVVALAGVAASTGYTTCRLIRSVASEKRVPPIVTAARVAPGTGGAPLSPP
jgi:hypothetical protein